MFNKYFNVLCAAMFGAAMLAPVTANALGTLTFNGAAAGSSKFDFIKVNTNRGSSLDVFAGPFDMSQTNPGTPLGDFIAWCFEIDANLFTGVGGTTSYSIDSVLETDQRNRVQKMFDANYHDATIETDKTKGAAFQLALWEVIYDSDFSLSSGAFTSSTGGNVGQYADVFLAAAKTYNDPQKWVITELKSGSAQDLGTVNAIPLPAAAWLLLGVSGALVMGKRRAARKSV